MSFFAVFASRSAGPPRAAAPTACQPSLLVGVRLFLVGELELLGVVCDAAAVVVVLHRGAHGLLGQHGAVDLVRGQAVERLDHRLVGELQGLVDGLADDQLRRHRARGDGAAAAEGVELAVGDDALVVHLDIHAHDVAALGVADLADPVGVVDLAHVARIAEMIHDLFTVQCHCCILPKLYFN